MIVKPFYVCTTDLLSLLITGEANGNVGAYTVTG